MKGTSGLQPRHGIGAPLCQRIRNIAASGASTDWGCEEQDVLPHKDNI